MISPAPLAQTCKALAKSSAAGAVENLRSSHSHPERLYTGLLCDWVTLRIKTRLLPPNLLDRIDNARNLVVSFDTDENDEIVGVHWESRRFDIDKLRSDEKGLFVSVLPIKADDWLYIGASPASLENACNVFGVLDVLHGAEVVRKKACAVLQAHLPPVEQWECVRLDVTGNYAFPDAAAVKLALRQLALSDSARRRATTSAKGGDSVYWSPTSDLIAGKAYHKGRHLSYLINTGKLDLPEEYVAMSDRLLRLEMRLGSRWFRRLIEKKHAGLKGVRWTELQAEQLEAVFMGFFGPIVGDVEVTGMERVSLEQKIEMANGMTPCAARSVLGTYRAIKAEGFEATKASMAERTFRRHVKALRAAGLTDAELVAGNVFQFRPVKIVLAMPVRGWEELRRVA